MKAKATQWEPISNKKRKKQKVKPMKPYILITDIQEMTNRQEIENKLAAVGTRGI